MKVESCSFYDSFDNFLDVSCGIILDREFVSIQDAADLIRRCVISHPTASHCIAFLNNWRYLFVTEDSFDVHYHCVFSTHKNYLIKYK